MRLQIRNMESDCCIRVVKDELNRLGLHYKTVKLGKVELNNTISGEKLQLIDNALKNAGLEIIYDNKNLIVERVKSIIYQLIYLSDDLPKPNFSDYISEKVNRNYTTISGLFKSVQGVTIEKYILGVKIERVKELLIYDQLSLNEISYKLKYSSIAHLSNQFRKITGLTPSFYRLLRNAKGLKKKI